MFVQLKQVWQSKPVGERIDVPDDYAKLMIQQGVAEAVASDPLAPLLQKAMEGMQAQLLASQTAQLESVIKQFGEAMSKSQKNAIPAIFGPGQKGDPKKSFGRFLLAVRYNDTKALEEMGSRFCEWEPLPSDAKADMTTNVGSRGGFLVPTEHREDIALRVKDMSIVRKYVRVIPMAGRTVEIPTPNYITAPSAGDTATLSGLVLRWTEEGTALNQSEPNLKNVELTNYELSGYSKLNNSLMADAPALEAWLKDLFATGVAWYEDYAFLRGDGVKKPYGMLTWIVANSFTQTRSAASAMALTDLAKLYGKLLRGTTPTSKIFWAGHNTILEKLLTMTGGDQVLFLAPPDSVHSAPRWTILGHDFNVTEKLPALNTAGDMILANGEHYLIGDRQQYEVAFSEHAGFTANQTYFRVVSRVGGMPWIKDKMTLSDASSTLGSFVALAAG